MAGERLDPQVAERLSELERLCGLGLGFVARSRLARWRSREHTPSAYVRRALRRTGEALIAGWDPVGECRSGVAWFPVELTHGVDGVNVGLFRAVVEPAQRPPEEPGRRRALGLGAGLGRFLAVSMSSWTVKISRTGAMALLLRAASIRSATWLKRRCEIRRSIRPKGICVRFLTHSK